MEKYLEMKKRHQNDVSNFEMFFAFDDKGVEDGKKQLGVKFHCEILSLGCGAFIRKTDRAKWNDLCKSHQREMKAAMKKYGFALSAFRYELSNHEYCLTYDTDDTLESLGLTETEVANSLVLSKALKKACETSSRTSWDKEAV